MEYYDSSINTIFGSSELKVYVTEPLQKQIETVYDTLDTAIQGALDKFVEEDGDIVYEPKPLNEIATARPNTGNVNMNGKSLTNLEQLSLVGGIAGIASSALSVGLSAVMFPNTGP